ncbi:hypothetical protein A2U01_0016582, partial [Trifolium medium]|nr:hypothetical protein [Trifolium medium]
YYSATTSKQQFRHGSVTGQHPPINLPTSRPYHRCGLGTAVSRETGTEAAAEILAAEDPNPANTN